MPTVFEASLPQKGLISLTLASFHAPFYSMSHYVLEDKTCHILRKETLWPEVLFRLFNQALPLKMTICCFVFASFP